MDQGTLGGDRAIVEPSRAGMLAAHCTKKQLKYVLHTVYSIHNLDLLKHHTELQEARKDVCVKNHEENTVWQHSEILLCLERQIVI